MRTDLSEEHVATIGKLGCGVVSQARESEGGFRSESIEIDPGNDRVSSKAIPTNFRA